jgi:hypothetical protein
VISVCVVTQIMYITKQDPDQLVVCAMESSRTNNKGGYRAPITHQIPRQSNAIASTIYI